jgi:hypothetical protein
MSEPMKRLLAAFPVLFACASSTSSPADAGAEAAVIKAPTVHRLLAEACPTDRPPSTPSGISGGSCTTDAECTQGKNGRCLSIAVGPPSCSYDLCAKDADCGQSAGVCQCRATAEGGANVCRQGNCRTDGDCGVTGKGFCSPSAVNIDITCRSGIPAGSFGYFCHAPSDECSSDSDCTTSPTGQACIFDPGKSHWACINLLCTD